MALRVEDVPVEGEAVPAEGEWQSGEAPRRRPLLVEGERECRCRRCASAEQMPWSQRGKGSERSKYK